MDCLTTSSPRSEEPPRSHLSLGHTTPSCDSPHAPRDRVGPMATSSSPRAPSRPDPCSVSQLRKKGTLPSFARCCCLTYVFKGLQGWDPPTGLCELRASVAHAARRTPSHSQLVPSTPRPTGGLPWPSPPQKTWAVFFSRCTWVNVTPRVVRLNPVPPRLWSFPANLNISTSIPT